MAELIENDPLMDALKTRTEFISGLPPEMKTKMLKYQDEIDEYLDSLPDIERFPAVLRLMNNKVLDLSYWVVKACRESTDYA